MKVAHVTIATVFVSVLGVTSLLASPAAAFGPSKCSKAHAAEAEDFVDLYIEIFNDHDMSRIDEVMAPNALNENPFGVMTVDELVATMEAFYAAFPDLQYQVQEVVVDDDLVVIEYTYTGTHLGPLMGVPPTGTVVHGRGLEIHTLDDGRITATRNYSDVFGLFGQLGLL